MTNDELRLLDRTLVWHAFTQMAEYEPLVIERAEGCELIDIDGRRYLDGVSSLWCNVHGHRHPRLDAAIRAQLDRVAHVTSLGCSNPTTIRLAQRLVALAPPGLGHVFFSDDGATAVEVALKMAFQYWRQHTAATSEASVSPLPGTMRSMVAGEGQGVREGEHLPDAPPIGDNVQTGERKAMAGEAPGQAALTPDPSPASGRGEQRGLTHGPSPKGRGGTRDCYLALGEAYHGDTLGAVSVGGVERFHAMFRPLLFETIRLPLPDTYRTPPGVAAADLCDYHLGLLEKTLAKHGHRIAAMVVEPLMQCAAGMVRHPSGYLRGVRELTRRYGVLLIADEVAVGFGRTGRMFACEHEGVVPDLLCLAKGLSGGYLPIAATLATDEIYNAFLGRYEESKAFFHGHTYGGNPLGAAVALASLDVFDEEQTLANLQPKIARLAEHLARIAGHKHVGHVRQCGLIAGIELVRDKATAEPFPWAEKRGLRVCDFARGQGVWLRPLGNVVVVMPPLAVTLAQLDRIMAAVADGIAATLP
jgi:adenosylmethionine-8-amino-7-oxononanoate aminotransferase